MESYKTRLTKIQADFLSVFFDSNEQFFLTDGAALIGFYGLSRTTRDLDIFTCDEVTFTHSESCVRRAADGLGLNCSVVRAFPQFRRYHLERGDETLEVDIVLEVAPQTKSEKDTIDGIRLDPLDEIAVNKVCTLVGRSEVRDLWDLNQLLERGYDLETLVNLANSKDGGVDLESTVLVLSSLNWDALEQAASRVGLKEFEVVRSRFTREAERLALKLLSPRQN